VVARTYLRTIVFNSDLDQWETKSAELLSRDEAAKNIKQLRQWAKDDLSDKKFRTIKVHLSI
jgi:hypothetical protein